MSGHANTAITSSDRVGIACLSCSNCEVYDDPYERPAGWVYIDQTGWLCPSCAEREIEQQNAEIKRLEARLAKADRLVNAVKAHQQFWARVNWESERCERSILEAIAAYEESGFPTHSGSTEARS